MNIADIGKRQFSDALTGKLSHCVVSEWIDDAGEPVKIYWLPLTGAEQKKIEAFGDTVDRVLMSIKIRARDADSALIFADAAIEGLRSQYDYNVMRAIAYLMATDIGNDIDETIEGFAKE